jgi:hypothetical protein
MTLHSYMRENGSITSECPVIRAKMPRLMEATNFLAELM